MSKKEKIFTSDQLFDSWDVERKEIRKHICGKYKDKFKDISVSNALYVYKGDKKICSHKFNFLSDYNKCHRCSSLSNLTKEGNIDSEIIEIKNGKNIGEVLQTSLYPLTGNFGVYRFIDVDYNSLTPFNKFKFAFKPFKNEQKTLQNNDSDESHYVACCSLLEHNNVKTPFLAIFICNKIRMLKKHLIYLPSPNQLLCYSILKTIYEILLSGRFLGYPNLNSISFQNKKSIINIGMEVEIPYTINLSPNGENAFFKENSYENCTYNIVSRNFKGLPNNGLKFLNVFTDSGKYGKSSKISRLSENPSFKDYEYNSQIVCVANEELFNFYENNSFTPLKYFDFYLWVLTLCTKIEYNNILRQSRLAQCMFIYDDIKIIDEVLNITSYNTYQAIKDLCIKHNIRFLIEPDVSELINLKISDLLKINKK